MSETKNELETQNGGKVLLHLRDVRGELRPFGKDRRRNVVHRKAELL